MMDGSAVFGRLVKADWRIVEGSGEWDKRGASREGTESTIKEGRWKERRSSLAELEASPTEADRRRVRLTMRVAFLLNAQVPVSCCLA